MALLGEFFRTEPKVPKFKPINIDAEQARAIGANATNLPASEAIASRVNAFNQSEYDKMLESTLPGYAGIKSRISKNISSQLAGEIPEDVSLAVQRNAASRSLYGGFSGSGMAKNLTARDLGLTSLDLTQQGLDSAQRWMSMARAPQFDVSSMFISPQQRVQFQASERDSKFQRDYVANLTEAQYTFGSRMAAAEDSLLEAL